MLTGRRACSRIQYSMRTDSFVAIVCSIGGNVAEIRRRPLPDDGFAIRRKCLGPSRS